MSTANPPVRPEYEHVLAPFTAAPLSLPLPWYRQLWQQGWLRKALLLMVLAPLWEIIARIQDNDLLLP
ncbi:MAG: ABC transporter permease, partial [Pseudomonadota bacterium]